LYVLKNCSANEGGFTLIEVLLSIFIVATLVALLAASINFVNLSRDAKFEDIALRIASQKLEAIRAAGYDNATSSGPFSDSLLSTLPTGSASSTVTTYNAKTKRIDVTVMWKGLKIYRSESVTTLITQVGGVI
jgi:prepilin-type N-terminal cleavage/methylation domain-containing protein